MAFAAPHFDFQRPPSQLSLHDRKSAAFSNSLDDDLDDPLFDSTIMSPFSQRKESFADHSVFSPQSATFDDPTTTWARDPSVSNNPFYEQNNNPFMRLGASQAASYGQQPTAWPVYDSTSGTCTPTTVKTLDSQAHDFDPAPASAFGHAVSNGTTSFTGVPVQNNVRPSSVFQPAKQPMPASPHTHKEWMALAQQEQESSAARFPKRMRHNTPPRTYQSSLPRGDGIRKKNARFEIPAERSLANIDDLIRQSTNDEEIKELKQQKRLLRNRQAALDSRQRKKRHTEELEDEKKQWVESQQQLEGVVSELHAQNQQLVQERQCMMQEQERLAQMLEQLTMEKEDMVAKHTRETGELRKKVSVLTERLESSTGGVPMSVTQSSTSYTDFASDMDNLNMGCNDWSDFFSNDFSMETEAEQNNFQQPSTQLVVHRKKDSPLSITEQDKPVASGLLLMLLLCGAFVASKSSGSAAPAIRVPDDVRAASAIVLDSVYKDAGVAPDQASARHAHLTATHLQALEPGPSGTAWSSKSTLTGAEFASLSNPPSALDTLQGQLTAPTKDQEAEQAFSITPAQYNSFTSADFSRRVYSIPSSDNDDPLSPLSGSAGGRRNLAETLASLREQSKDGAAEVYTRSLLWDKIPAEVVRDFKRMVEESQELAARQERHDEHVKAEPGMT